MEKNFTIKFIMPELIGSLINKGQAFDECLPFSIQSEVLSD